MASYLNRTFSTLVKVIQKCVHHLIFWVGISYRNWQNMCNLEYVNVIHCGFPCLMCDLLISPVIYTFSEKVMFAQCDCNFSMHFIPYIGNSAINLLLCTCKIFLIAFFHNIQHNPLLFLDNIELIYKFICIVKISSPVILLMWENKSGAGADPHPFWTWWFLIYMLSSATLPLNVRIIQLDPFSDGYSFYVACVCNHYFQKNQNRCSMMDLTCHFLIFPTLFLLIAFLFHRWRVWKWWFLVRVIWYVLFYTLLWKFCWLYQWIRICWSCQWTIFCWSCQCNIFS